MGSKQIAAKGLSNILQNVGLLPSKTKTPKQLERHLKGLANHWRISILFLIAKRRGISLDEITSALSGNAKTISVHSQKLVAAGLVHKKYLGRSVLHELTPYGEIFYRILKTF